MDHLNRRKPGVINSYLRLEPLESRLNLSTLHGIAAPRAAVGTHTKLVGAAVTKTAALISSKIRGGATDLSATAAIPVGSYSAIYNSALETQNGQQDIGYVSWAGAYVEYTVTAPAAGTYSLGMGLASLNRADIQVAVNGVNGSIIDANSTGSWQQYASAGSLIQLNAGQNTIRLSSLYGTIYNIANLSLTPAGRTTIGDNTSVGVASYSAISGSQVEYSNGVPDIGYVSTSGATVDYSINVATAGTYTFTVNASTANNIASFNVLDNGTKLTSFAFNSTGGWQSYGSFSQTVTLAAGNQTIRFASTNGTQYNLRSLQWVRQIPVTAMTATTTTTPVVVPPAQTAAVAPVTIAQRWMTSFTELDITATAANESLVVTQSGNTFTVNANGQTQTVTGTFGDLVVNAGSGNATVTIDSSVNISARLYSGTGNDILKNLTTGQATIVTMDGGKDTVTGNGINTAYWVDSSDTVNASVGEKGSGDVHVIANFYQPYTSVVGATGYVTSVRDGSNLVDPTSAGNGTTRLTSSSFWGTGPVQADVNQGQAEDCYFLSTLQSFAQLQPGKLQQMAVDLGDGTFAVQFQRAGKTTYVRVDGDLPTSQWGGLQYDHIGASGDQWVAIMEKAYAYFRTGSNSYSSLDWGFNTSVYSDLGINSSTLVLPADQNSFFNTVSAKLAANKGADILTNPTIVGSAPLIGSHCYSINSISKDSSGTVWVTVRNPWGYDAFNDDSNPGDGFVTIQYSTLLANSTFAALMA